MAIVLESDFGLSRGRHCLSSARTKIAQQNGAVGVLFLAGFYQSDFEAVVNDE